MARNIEIKARIESLHALVREIAAISSEGPVEIVQDDTFFHCESGRLKLRAFPNGTGELIFYRRANQKGPKESFYFLAPTNSPDALCEALSLAYGQSGRVKKHRTLFIAGRTRIHIDRVEGLGNFLELEVALIDGEASEDGKREALELMVKLGVLDSQLIEGAYIDMQAK